MKIDEGRNRGLGVRLPLPSTRIGRSATEIDTANEVRVKSAGLGGMGVTSKDVDPCLY